MTLTFLNNTFPEEIYSRSHTFLTPLLYIYIEGVLKVPGRLDNLRNMHHRKNNRNKSCRIFSRQSSGDLGFDPDFDHWITRKKFYNFCLGHFFL